MTKELTWFALSAIVAIPSLVHGQTDDAVVSSDDRRDHSRIAVTAGLATPNGELGVEYVQAFQHHLDLALGAGIATSLPMVRHDPQVSIMPRFRLRSGPVTFSVGAGLSAGHYTTCFGLDCGVEQDMTALWANVEVGVQITSKQGPFVRLFVGDGYVVAHSALESRDAAYTMKVSEPSLPYAGLAVGSTL